MLRNFFSVERKGYAAHYWFGPIGFHIFRDWHVSRYKHLNLLEQYSPVWVQFKLIYWR